MTVLTNLSGQVCRQVRMSKGGGEGGGEGEGEGELSLTFRCNGRR